MCLWSRSKRFGGFYDSGEIVLSMYHISREIMLGQYVHTVSYVVLLLVRHSERERERERERCSIENALAPRCALGIITQAQQTIT